VTPRNMSSFQSRWTLDDHHLKNLPGLALLTCLLFVAGSAVADTSPPASGVREASQKVSPAVTARKSTGEKSEKKLDNPQALTEIIEKTISVSESAGTGQDPGNPDLPVEGRITSTVGLRHDPINGNLRFHNGIDIAIPEGTPVTPVAAGRVAYSGLQPGYGNMVIVQHADGMVSIYAHHKRNLVKTGERVSKDSRLAFSGSTGHSTGPHLHFEAWQGGRNVTEAFLPNFAGRQLAASTHESLDKTNLRKTILRDGTILFVDIGKSRTVGAFPGKSRKDSE
jgi:murein DD-endopeptidase MepM/ murein hydrolase activator NlpD